LHQSKDKKKLTIPRTKITTAGERGGGLTKKGVEKKQLASILYYCTLCGVL
jgi:hypothetical protein